MHEYTADSLSGSNYLSIPPNLGITIDTASTVNRDIFTAQNPPRACALEIEEKDILLPVRHIVAK